MAVGQVGVRQVARDGVEDAGADRGVVHAEVVAVEDVVGGDVVQAARGVLVAVVPVSTRPTTKSTTSRRTCRRNSATVISLPGSFAFLTTGCWLYASSAGPVAAQTKSGPRMPASQ